MVQTLSYVILGKLHVRVMTHTAGSPKRLELWRSGITELPLGYQDWDVADMVDWVAAAIAELAGEN